MKILLADPDRDFLTSYGKILEIDGHEVETAFDGTQVITKTAGSRFDLVLLNSDLPRIDSVRIVCHLNEEGVPAAVLSGDGKKIEERFKEEKVAAYLYFPFGPAEMRSLVREAVKEDAK